MGMFVVIGVNIVYKDAAKTQVDPAKSYVNCIEQAGFLARRRVTGRPPGFQTMKTVAESTLVNIILLNLQVKKESPTVNDGYKARCYVPFKMKAFND